MKFQYFCYKRVSFIIFILLFTQNTQAFIFNTWQWIFIKENFSQNRPYTKQLFSAVKSSDKVKAREALEKGASINARDKKGRTPLHWAVYRNDISMAEWLLNNGADPNAVNRRRRTPLHWAVLKYSNELTLLLLKHGANPNAQDLEKLTPLHWLALKPDHSTRSHLKNRTSKKDDQKEYEFPLLWNKKDFEKMQLLLSYDADPNIQDERVQTPLYYAVMNDRLEVVQLLAQNGAKVDAKNWVEETALYFISKLKKLKPNSFVIAQFLLESGADPNAQNIYKITPMKLSAQNQNYELQEVLGQFGGILPPQNLCMKLFQKWTKKP